MTIADPDTLSSEARRARLFTRINKLDAWFQVFGLAWITPVLKAAAGDNPKAQMKEIWRLLAVPVIAIAAFLLLWGTLAPKVQTSLGAIPGPAAVWAEAVNLHQDAQAKAAKQRAHAEKVEARNQRFIDRGQPERVKDIPYTGAPSYYQQIWTSIQTVFFGFLIASAVAIPLGILAGLSPVANSAINPLVQIFKPVSPLAWLPIVTMIVSAMYASNDRLFDKLADAMGHEEWKYDERFRTNPQRAANRDVLIPIMTEILIRQPRAHWQGILDDAGVPNAPTQDIGEVLQHPQTLASGMVQNNGDGGIDLIGLPLKFDGERPPLRNRAPALGADNAAEG